MIRPDKVEKLKDLLKCKDEALYDLIKDIDDIVVLSDSDIVLHINGKDISVIKDDYSYKVLIGEIGKVDKEVSINGIANWQFVIDAINQIKDLSLDEINDVKENIRQKDIDYSLSNFLETEKDLISFKDSVRHVFCDEEENMFIRFKNQSRCQITSDDNGYNLTFYYRIRNEDFSDNHVFTDKEELINHIKNFDENLTLNKLSNIFQCDKNEFENLMNAKIKFRMTGTRLNEVEIDCGHNKIHAGNFDENFYILINNYEISSNKCSAEQVVEVIKCVQDLGHAITKEDEIKLRELIGINIENLNESNEAYKMALCEDNRVKSGIDAIDMNEAINLE